MKHEGAISEEKFLVMFKEKEVKSVMNVKWSSGILTRFTNPYTYSTRQVTYITGESAVTYYGEHTS